MNKSTLSIIIAVVASLTILGVIGEYLAYKYYALLATQPAQQTAVNLAPNTSITQAQATSGSSENAISSFYFKNPMAIGSIDTTNHNITITVPPDTDVTQLTPTIEISANATIVPAPGTPQDFTNPVSYTVTAQNNSIQKYMVTVNVASVTKSVERLITSFKFLGLSPAVSGSVNNTADTVDVVVPDGTNLLNLTPTITVSDGATVSPASASAQDFSTPVLYTVTDIYGGTQIYTVTVVTESNSG